MKVSIIGGNGNMGKLIEYLLGKHGFKVYLLGRKSTDFNKRIKESDVVIFSVPIFALDETLKNLEKLDLKNKLLVDLSSGVFENMKKLEKYSKNVAFIHLMFGPDIRDIKNQNIIVSKGIKNKSFLKFVDVLEKEGAQISFSTPEHHDYMMAIVQALSQFSSISLAKTISEEQVSLKDLNKFSSVTFSLNREVISRIVMQKPELWSAIQFNNPFFKKIVDSHLKNIEKLAQFVENKDYEGFREMFVKMAGFWNSEKNEISAVEDLKNVKENSANIKFLKNNKENIVGLLGPKGSYSEQALMQIQEKYKNTDKGSESQVMFFDSIDEVILALSSGKISKAILPFENSIQGTVLETLDGLYRHKLKINEEVIVKINHVISGLDKKIPANQIKYIYSHPQALGQCRTYVEEKYPKAKLVITPSTSFAFRKIRDEGLTDSLAIGSRFASDVYGLSCIDENIQDVKNNQTLFFNVSKKGDENVLAFTFLVIDPRADKTGLLYEILSLFKSENINLLKIESRPSREKLGSYIFYLKAEIPRKDKKVITLVNSLKKFGAVTLLT